MTAEELINILERYHPDTQVVLAEAFANPANPKRYERVTSVKKELCAHILCSDGLSEFIPAIILESG